MENEKRITVNNIEIKAFVTEIVQGQAATIKDKLRHVHDKQVCMENQLEKLTSENIELKSMFMDFQNNIRQEMQSLNTMSKDDEVQRGKIVKSDVNNCISCSLHGHIVEMECKENNVFELQETLNIEIEEGNLICTFSFLFQC